MASATACRANGYRHRPAEGSGIASPPPPSPGRRHDATRELVERPVGDAEHAEVLDQSEAVVPVRRERPGHAGNAVDHRVMGEPAAIARMRGVGDEPKGANACPTTPILNPITVYFRYFWS